MSHSDLKRKFTPEVNKLNKTLKYGKIEFIEGVEVDRKGSPILKIAVLGKTITCIEYRKNYS